MCFEEFKGTATDRIKGKQKLFNGCYRIKTARNSAKCGEKSKKWEITFFV